jgi:hypothetical protein
MARIAQYQKEKIVEFLVEPINEKLEKARKEIGEVVDEFVVANTPKEVFEFAEKYPNICNIEKEFYYNYIKCLAQKIDGCQIPLSRPKISGAIPEFWDRFNASKDCEKIKNTILPKIMKLEKIKREIRGKSSCVLDTINTYKQLQEQFPEAYKILIEKIDKEAKIIPNRCDSIEGLRAQLSQITEEK